MAENGDTKAPELTPQAEIDSLIQQLRTGVLDLSDVGATEHLVCDGVTALRVLTAPKCRVERVWAGTVTTDLDITDELAGGFALWGSVRGNLNVLNTVQGQLIVGGRVGLGIYIAARVDKNVVVMGSAAVDEDVSVMDRASIKGNLTVERDAAIGGYLSISEQSSLSGDLVVWGSVGRYLSIDGSVGGHLTISGSVGKNVFVRGSVGKPLFLNATVGNEIHLDPTRPMTVFQLTPIPESAIFIGPKTDLTFCDFSGFAAYDKLRFLGDQPFRTNKGRQELAFEFPQGDHVTPPTSSQEHGTPHAEQAAIYRQLRVALEKNSNRPAASDFYYGETEARRNAIADRTIKWFSIEWWILSLYKGLSAYGTRSLRTFAIFALTSIVFAVFMSIGGIDLSGFVDDLNENEAVWEDSWTASERWTLLRFTIQSMVSFFSPPRAANLTNAEGFAQLTLRFIGPLLLAQAALAIRDRVAR